MCGIAGIVGGAGDYAANLTNMIGAQAHRGPDGSGTLAYEGGTAGAVRLALVDLSERGQMPIWSPDGKLAILFNGEIYNYAQERSRLAARDYPFCSSTDTEVILALYLEHGLDFVHYLRGMFALAILDWRESTPGGKPTLVLARDHFGIKPLYLAQPKGSSGPLVFASEIRSLLASGLVPKQIDREGLMDYLALGFVVQPRTIIAGVEMLERGSLMRITPAGAIERRSFWKIPASEPVIETFEESAERLRAVLEESVALHAMADAPVGAFLSGGVDSSGVVALMIKKNPRLRTYSLRLADFPESDESAQAEAFARSLGCQHTTMEVSGGEILDLLPSFAAEIDQPSSDGLNTWLISRTAAKDVKGVLSGTGGDEWFSGYAATRNMAKYASGSPYAWAGKVAAAVRNLVPDSYLGRRLEGLASKAEPLATWIDCRRVFGYGWATRLVGVAPASCRLSVDIPETCRQDGGAAHNGYAEIERILTAVNPEWRRESVVGLSCLLDVDVYMRCQLLRDCDMTSMASSLELRVPLVDLKVAEFSRSCADEFKLHLGGGAGGEYAKSGAKRVLIHALRDILPADIGQRPKRGFSIPYKHWVRNDLMPLVEDTCSRRTIVARGLLDPDLASRLASDSPARDRWLPYPLAWPLMILELWCRAVIDGRGPLMNPQITQNSQSQPLSA